MSLLTEMYENGECDESLYGFVRKASKKFMPGRKKRFGRALIQRKFIRPTQHARLPGKVKSYKAWSISERK